MGKALYRKYRSKTLDEIVGQSHVTDILREAIKQDRISHAYLLTGPRGIGKTSIARILAHEINGIPYDDDTTHLDIIEIDAASNNGVEDVRDLRDKVQIAPASSKKRIYIIDEVHMLSKAAFNALLKTLEEPPEHIVFILATTDVDKLPATIVSRTQRFSLRSIGVNDAVAHLRFIADAEKIKVDDASLILIAERSDGSFRDSISLLDQLSSIVDTKTGITTAFIESSLGLAPKEIITQLLTSVETHDITALVHGLDAAFDQGIGGIVLSRQLTDRVRELVIEKPELLPLLDTLLDVAKSAQPNLKLLSVLGNAASLKHTSKTVALAAPVLEVTATIAELEKQAVTSKPKIVETLTKEPPARRVTTEAIHRSTEPVTITAKSFNPTTLIEHARKKYVAIYSVLSKCTFMVDGNVLIIYTGNKFYKSKLDDAKYSPLIYTALEEVGVFGLEIHTIPTGPPPSDEHAVAVAVIMGGGEEVSVETV